MKALSPLIPVFLSIFVAELGDKTQVATLLFAANQNLAPGLGGITYQEIATALYPKKSRPPLVSVIGGLGGKDIAAAEFEAILHDLERTAAGEQLVSPRLLYTRPEQDRMRTLLKIAGKEIIA